MGSTRLEPPVLEVQLFGSFSIYYLGKRLTDAYPRAQHIWKLLKYLLVNQGKMIPTDALIQLLWAKRIVDNPQKALQNLVYRLRSILPKGEGAPEYILFHHNAYGWNPAAALNTDTAMFEKLIQGAAACAISGGASECEQLCRQAFETYRGEFLEDLSHEDWVMPLAGYYRRLYYQCADTYLGLLERRGAYETIIEVCERALAIDAFEERYHVQLINALLARGKRARAVAHFEQVTALLRRELAVEPSDRLKAVGRQLYLSETSPAGDRLPPRDLGSIMREMGELSQSQGPYVCDITVFKELYRVQLRASERAGKPVYMVLLTLVGTDFRIPAPLQLEVGLQALKSTCVQLLRKSDILSQSGTNQLLLMLAVQEYEHCEKIIRRIERHFYTLLGKGGSIMLHKIRPINPLDVQWDEKQGDLWESVTR